MSIAPATTDFVNELDEDFNAIEKDDESKATYVFEKSGHMRLIVENLERMRQNEVLLDLEIINQEGTCYKFHRWAQAFSFLFKRLVKK